MQYRSTTREESPSHQQLFRRNASLSGQPRRSSVTPSRNNYALAVVPPGSGADAASPHADEMVYVADVNPVYSVSAAVRCLAPVNDRVMWSAEFNGSLSVRALPKGTVLRTLPGREGTCCISLMYLPESDQMWAGFQDGYLHVYNARTMDLVTETMAHAGGLNCMVQVDDSVFTGGTDWKVTQWSVDGANGAVRQQRTLHGHRGGVRCFAVYDGPTGSVLFSGSDDGTIRAWDPYPAEGDGKKKSSNNNNDSSGVPAANIHTFTGHRRAVLSLCVVSHMNQVWSGGEDMTVRVWDMQTLECLSVLRSGHTAPVANLMLVESRVWSADKHGHVLLWDVLTRSLLQDLADRVPYWGIGQGMIMAMGKVQPTTAYKVWTASSNGVLQCWNAETIPIVFDDVPVAAGAFQGTGAGMMGSNDHLTAAAAGGNGSELNTPTGRHGAAAKDSAEVAGMNVSTANRSTNNPNTPTGCGAAAGADGSDDTSSPARMHEYVQQLQAELQDTQRDAKMAYEKYRLEVQLEVETQQLLSEENARLRERVQELEGMVGERPRELTSEPATSALDSAAAQQQQPMMVAELEAWQAEVDSLRQQLDDANRQLEEALQQQNQQHRDESPSTIAERSPEPLQPFSHVREAAAAAAPALDEAEKARLQQQLAKAAADNKRLMDANARQRVEAHQHQRSMEKLQEQLKATQAELDHLREEHDALDAYVHDTLKPTISSMERARDELKVDKQRLLDQLAAATEKAPLTSSDADVQQQLEDFAALQAYVHDQLKPMIARLKRARGELTLDKDRLLEKLAAAEEKLAAAAGESTERAPLTSSDADVQQQLEDFAALQAYVHDQLKPMIARLKRARGELTLDKDRLLEKLAAAEEKLAAAAGDSTERAPLTSSDADVQQQLEDFAALQAYVHDQLKPMIARLKRARGELTLDKDRLLEKLAAAEEKLAAAAGESTERAPLTSSDADVQQQLEDFAALQAYVHDQLKPMIARLKRARGELTLDKDRLLEKLAAAEEKLAAAAGESTERAPLTSSDADVQQQLEDFAALQAYVHDQLKPMIARLKRARGELTLDKDRLLEKLAAAEEKLAAAAGESTERAPLTSSDADVQQQLEDFAALQAYVHDQLKPMIARLKRARGELTLDKDRLLEKLAAAEEKLAAAAGESTERAPLTSSDADVQQQLEDFAALQAYVHDQLKPMIARLKRARGELTLDKDRLLEKLAAAEEKLAAAAGDSTERAPLTSSDADVQQQLEDFAALQAYVHDQLKPMIARLKRARGELTLDKDRLLEKLAAAEEKLAAAAGESTERAPLTSSDADVQQQLEDFAALQAYVHDQLKPMIARLKRARGELTLDKDRLLEKLAAAEEKLAAAAGESTERAPLTSSDADVQQQLEDFAALQAYVHDQLKPMIARLKRARGELTLDKDRLLEKLAAAEEKLAAAAGESTERAPLTSSDADVQQQLEDFAALQAYVHDQLKPMIARLKRARGELTLDKDRLLEKLAAAEEKLAAAAGESTERAPLTSSDADVQQQLEDFAALQAYVHDQLKPMIARLKRARGELTLDKDRLLEKLAAAEEKLAAAAGESTERAPLTSSDADVQQQLEDFAALQAYVHDQLKPMIARLKRARGELTLDKDRLLEKLAAAEEKLAAAAGESTERAPLTSSDADVQQQLEDFAALQAYVHDQLKPMIARLKRARGELTLDKDRLLEKLAAAEEKLAAAAGESTERAPLTSSDADVQQQLEDFAALQAYVHDQLKPMIARLKRARGELTLDKDRLLEKLAAAEEKLAAAAGESTERAPLTSSDADVQQQLEDFAALQAYVHDQLKPMIARLKRARGELTLDKDRLLEKLAAAEEKLAAAAGESTERAPLTSSDADVQQQLEDFAALQAYVHDQLKPMIARLKRARGELTLDKDRLLEKLAVAEEKLAAAAGESTERAPLTSSDADVQQQLEDFAALQAYVHDQLKPMIARLKRARGELTLDKDRLLEKLAAAEEKLAAAAGDSTERAPLTSSDADVQQQLEDFAALQAYVHDQLKPMIARLKRARGELTLDKERLADDLRNACELYEDASAALEESRVREEKMGETLDALQKALEAEQQKNQRLVEALEGSGVPLESVTGRKTEAALLNPNEHHNRRDDGQARDSAATVGEASPRGLGQDDEDAKVRASLDRLAAQNLDLSVRLADAETVIAQLQNSLLTAGDASRPKQ